MSNKYEASKYASDSDESDAETSAACVDVEKLPPLEIGPGEHKLQYSYCLWYHRGSVTKFKSPSEYSKSLHFVGRCGSVEQFWSMYCHLVRPSAMKPYRELHLFKAGIKPMWEDPTNALGGKWVIRLRKNKIDRAWESVCMAMLGEQFLVGPEVCGIVLSTRYPEDLLSVWNRTASDTASTMRIRDTLRRILNLPPTTPLEYKNHNECLKYIKSPASAAPINSSAATASSTLSSSSSAAAAAASNAMTTLTAGGGGGGGNSQAAHATSATTTAPTNSSSGGGGSNSSAPPPAGSAPIATAATSS